MGRGTTLLPIRVTPARLVTRASEGPAIDYKDSNCGPVTEVTSLFVPITTKLWRGGLVRHEQQIHQLTRSPGSGGTHVRRFRHCTIHKQHIGCGAGSCRSGSSAS